MSPFTAIILIIAVILLITGGVVKSLSFLLWVAVALLLIGVISSLMGYIGRK